jgi:hypothetical protein
MSTGMSSYDRTRVALERRMPDRAPVFCFCSEETRGTSAGFRSFVAAHADVFHTRELWTGFQCTGIEPRTGSRSLPDGWTETQFAFDTGLTLKQVSKAGDAGNYIGYARHPLGSREDLLRVLDLPWIPPAGNPGLESWLREIEESARRLCAGGAFFRIAFLGPLGTLAGAMGPEDFAILCMEDEPLVRRYLDTMLERQAAYLDHVLSRLTAPAIMNIGGAEYAIPPLMPPDAFGRWIEPYDGELIRLMHRHGRLVYYHSHGKVRRFLPRFIAMQADGIHPLEPTGNTGDCDLAEVKREFGGDICLIGNVQYDDLARLPEEAVRGLVREACAAGARGGGFILSPSCTPYHDPMPPAVERNLMAFIEAGLEHGAP